MNAVEIEEAVSALAERPFDAAEFPFAFLEAFDNKATTLKKLRAGATNKSDIGGVLQTSNIHIAVAEPGEVSVTLARLRASPATTKAKAMFILATDGETLEAEMLDSDDPPLVCAYTDLPNYFGYFLSLAGITTVRQVRDSSVDIRATSRLNKLYVELLKINPDWGSPERRHDMNHFMARLIFCFFAEDTGIFHGSYPFTGTVEKMSARDSSDTHTVIAELFRAMNTRKEAHDAEKIKSWAKPFPYVNGGLFSGGLDVPEFSKIARAYFIHIGGLDWTKINPDIFGSMIQAVADDEERGALGMHYTSVPNILKVLNPLFLDDLREKLKDAGDNPRKLLNLRNRMTRIRVFDPACGSGNFLVIAYRAMRKIEAEINRRRREPERASDIPLTNFRGIEVRDFPAEIARLALIIAEYQADVLYRGERLALAEFLPLNQENWITCGNALRLDWLSICPPNGTGARLVADDLFQTPVDQAQIEFENVGGETYICGNPPYRGSTWQTDQQKLDLQTIFACRTTGWKSLDYVTGWFMKAADYGASTTAAAAFVSTNSICQGQQVSVLWPLIFNTDNQIIFAHTSFNWANLASHNAGVTVVIVGISSQIPRVRRLYSSTDSGASNVNSVGNIGPYLVTGPNVIVYKKARPPDERAVMTWGNKPADGGNLILDCYDRERLIRDAPEASDYVRAFPGASEFIQGIQRFCLWIADEDVEHARTVEEIDRRLRAVTAMRNRSEKKPTLEAAATPNRFVEIRQTGSEEIIVIPGISSENRPFLPCGILRPGTILSNKNYAFFNAPVWNMALIASRLHLVWIATVCVRLRTDYSYSNTLGWNTFPVPPLTEKNKADLTRCAEDILLAREAHFPATIADIYDPERMDRDFPDLRAAHERNDETLERIYIGRRFKNDTERLEKLFELYTKMVGEKGSREGAEPRRKGRAKSPESMNEDVFN